MSTGGKGDDRRNENRAAVEANWPTDWNAREREAAQRGIARPRFYKDGDTFGVTAVEPEHE
jgi:hypothetical protein